MNDAPRVALLTDAAMRGHVAPGHPERPERLAAASEGVELGARAAAAALAWPEFTPATDAQITAVHDPRYLASLRRAASAGGGWLDADTYLGTSSVRAAEISAGATVAAALAVAGGEAEVGFAVGRPPGHHAARAAAGGFCLLNNVAIAVEALRGAGIARRIAIVDWDVHHGDGTQAIFDADPDVCYASSHQSPLFPGTGDADETGTGAGSGTMHNVPLPPGSGDEIFLAAWRTTLLPAIEAFSPAAILVSAGYDAHAHDPLANLEVTEDGYRTLARELGGLARRLELPGVSLTLEGGYDLEALRASVAATVAGLLEGLRPVGER